MGIEVAFVSAHGWRRLVYYVWSDTFHLEVARSDSTIFVEAENSELYNSLPLLLHLACDGSIYCICTFVD